MVPGREYSYAIRALNKCGTSKISPTLSFFLRRTVNVLTSVQVAPINCGFIITWNGGENAEVEILNNSFLPLSGCTRSGCTVRMSQLMNDPYNMKAG